MGRDIMPTETWIIIILGFSLIVVLLMWYGGKDDKNKKNKVVTISYPEIPKPVTLEERMKQLGIYEELRQHLSNEDYNELYNEFYSYFREGISFGYQDRDGVITAIFQSIRDSKLELMTKVLGFAEKHIAHEGLHFIYNRIQDVAYRQRETSLSAIDMTVEICKRDIELLRNSVGSLFKPNPYFTDKRSFCDLSLPCADRLLIILEKQGKIEEALTLAKEIKDMRTRDSQLVSYDERRFEEIMLDLDKRIARLEKKMK